MSSYVLLNPTMRICYLDISSSYSHCSLALPLLHAACERTVPGEWHVARGTIKDGVHTLVEEAVACGPDVVISTLYLFNHDLVLRVLRRIHALRPESRVLLGGPEFLGDNESFLRRERHVTAVFRGEGEEALPRILTTLGDRTEWRDIPGLCWIGEDGEYRDNGRAQIDESSWNALSPPIAGPFFDWSKPFIHVETCRGCPHRCSFCTSSCTGPLRWLRLDRIRDILRGARRHGVREIRVLDRTFNASPKKALERLRLFREEFGDLRFHLEIHPAFLNDDLERAFASAPPGLLHLEVGLQTTHPEALAACGRAGAPDVIWRGVQFLCACRNLDIHVDLLGGLPRLPLRHLLHDLAQVSGLGPAEIQLEILKVLPGTPIADDAAKYGLVHAPDPPYEVLETAEMGLRDLRTVAHLSRIVDRYYNHPALQPAVIAAIGAQADFYMAFLTFLRRETELDAPSGLERRAQLLHRYLDGRSPEAAGLVAYHWIAAGLSPQKCPGRASRWRGRIPDGAVAFEGGDADRDGPGPVWMLERPGVKDWFVFDRARDRNRPVAVYRAEEDA